MARTSLLVGALAAATFASAQLTPSPEYNPPSPDQGKVSSPSGPNQQWGAVLGNSLWFYDAQRSGKLSKGTYGNRVSWRNDSTLEDGSDYGVDLSGGWYDAGDYIKATFPLGFTMMALSWGALSYGPGYDAVNQTAYLDGTLRWGFDWLMNAHPSDDQLFVQVGSDAIDNDYWGGDENIPTPRPSFPVNASNPGTDVWASTAAAFAIGAMAYAPNLRWNTSASAGAPASLSNASYSGELLKHAKSLYDVAKSTTPYSTYSDSINVGDAYPSTNYQDDLTVAALTLAAATNGSDYYDDAYGFYQSFKLSGKQSVWNWDSRTPAAYVLFAEIAAARPNLAVGAARDANLTGWQFECEQYFDRIVDEKMDRGYFTKAGLLYYTGDSGQASLNPAMAAAALMIRYAPLASSPEKKAAYETFAKSQIDYVMGKNPVNVPYMVGIHPNSPKSAHSGTASGGNNLDKLRTDPPENLRVLYGAVVGGPLADDLYWDWRDDWVQNEVALDYNANFPALAAFQIMNNSGDPYYVEMAGTYSIPAGLPCDDALPCSNGLSGGAIAGIVVGTLIGAALIATIVLCIWKRDRVRRIFGR